MAVSHVKSNIIPDFTGTVTVLNSQGSTVTVGASDLVRPSDWNSGHNQFSTISGNTLGASTASGTNIVMAGGDNITLSANGSTISIHGRTDGLTSQSNQNVTAANGGFAFQTLSFSNANGMSFGTSAGSAITGSYTVPTVPAQLSVGVSTGGNTAGDTGVFTGRVVFVGSDNITLSGSSNGGSATISLFGQGGLLASSMTVSDAATSGTLARLAFTNLNGVTLSLSTGVLGSHTIVGSHNALTSQSNQAVSNSAGSFTFQTLNFSNANNVTFGTSAGGIVTASVVAGESRVSAYAVSNTTQSTSGTIPLSALSFHGAGIASVGVSNGSVVISVPAGGGGGDGGVFAGVSTGGNTAGSTGTVSTGNFVLVGSNGITLSQSTGAAGSAATITIQGDARTISSLVIQPFAGMAAGLPFAQSSSSLGQNSLYFYPFQLEDHLTVDHVKVPVMMTHSSSAAASVQKGYTCQFGLYTRINSTQVSRLYSTSYTMAASHSSNASWMISIITAIGNSTSYSTVSASSAGLNLSSSVHGPRELIMPISTLLTPGDYIAAWVASTSSVGAGGNIFNMSNIVVALQSFNRMGVATNTSNRAFYNDAGMGIYSATTGALPATVGMTQINLGGTHPVLFFGSGTV